MSSRTNVSSSIAQSHLMELYETTRVVDDGGSTTAMHWRHLNQFAAAIEAEVRAEVPIDMVLFCPACGMQHIDATDESATTWKEYAESWSNPPHRSHLCGGCGHIWRPADVPTNGVKAVLTKGKKDSPIIHPALVSASVAGAGEAQAESASAFKSRLILDACSKWGGNQNVEAGDIIEWVADYRIAALGARPVADGEAK